MDDAERRAALARRGLAASGVARSGVARADVTPGKVVESLLVEVADLRSRQDAERARMARGRSRAGEQTTHTRRKKRNVFVDLVDAELAKSDETSIGDAIARVVKRTGARRRLRRRKIHLVPWAELTPIERKRALDAAKKRYKRAKSQL